MNNISRHLSIVNCLIALACGSNSSQPVEQEPVSEISFSLWVIQENKCKSQTGVQYATVLTHKESPNQNPQAEYTNYSTDKNGLIQLDLELGIKGFIIVIASRFDGYRNINIV